MKRFVLALLFCTMMLSAAPTLAKPARTSRQAAKIKMLQWPSISRRNHRAYFYEIPLLQSLLNFRGVSVEVDGDFGPQTEAAVKKFQRTHGLKADGIAGPQTLQKLIVRLKRGAKGEIVHAVQDSLVGEVDTVQDRFGKEAGSFGFETEKDVRELQAHAGLTVDGIIGPET
ncbi:MAG TPA: peptidoglycan-binding protein [Abditibacteriaceae bacterium]|nr:peptidoglycan-binding protein [Abditibacteriaceae bacterium]